MAERCNCSDQGDATVFGACYKCDPSPEEPRTTPRTRLLDLPRLLPSWVFVVPAEPAERPYERVLGPDELEG